MKPDPRFLNQPRHFWANVRSISQHIGYTKRGFGQILIPDLKDLVNALTELKLGAAHIVGSNGQTTPFGNVLLAYFNYRADVLNTFVEPRLQNERQAEKMFRDVRKATESRLPVPMNKQKGKKKKPAYLTAVVNMLIDFNIKGFTCNYDPRELTTFTCECGPLRTLARRIDGAFPSVINPLAVWEIKEYYHTTTFGSRVADGVYTFIGVNLYIWHKAFKLVSSA